MGTVGGTEVSSAEEGATVGKVVPWDHGVLHSRGARCSSLARMHSERHLGQGGADEGGVGWSTRGGDKMAASSHRLIFRGK